MTDKGLIFSGARARMLIDGVPFGFALIVSGSEEIQWDPLEVLNNLEVQEHVPIAYRVTLSASKVWVIRETLKSQGFMPKGGSSSVERLRNLLNQSDLTVLIEDSQTGEFFYVYEQVKVATHNWTIQAKAIVNQDVTFVAIRAKDSSEI